MCLIVKEIPEWESHGWVEAWKVCRLVKNISRPRLTSPFRSFTWKPGEILPKGKIEITGERFTDSPMFPGYRCYYGGVLHLYTSSRAAERRWKSVGDWGIGGWVRLLRVWVKSKDVLAYGTECDMVVKAATVEKDDYKKAIDYHPRNPG